MNASSRLLVVSSTISPLSLKTFAALDTMIRPPNQGAVPSVRKTGSHAAWASEVPAGPGVAPMTATGRPPNTLGMSTAGLDSQSIAFFSTPGIELLYSGVTIKRPSASAILVFNSRTGAGMPSAAPGTPTRTLLALQPDLFRLSVARRNDRFLALEECTDRRRHVRS